MDKEYAEYLLAKTRRDYDLISQEFSASRNRLWEGLYKFSDYLEDGDRILDSGCGNGRLIELFKGLNVDYLGIDSSSRMIETAKEKYPGYKFEVADALSLHFVKNSFDKIFSIATFHHIPSEEFRLQFLKEAKRVLKPGGFLILTVWKLPFLKENYLKLKFLILGLLNLSKLDSGDVLIPWGRKVDRYCHCFTKKELIKLIEKSGFGLRDAGIMEKRGSKYSNIYIIAKKPS